MKQRGKKAVSPVLATLMMAAVAVAMSVVIFTWSQGFLSQTGEAASGQQAAQNIAAQSGILIDAVVLAPSTNTANGTATIYLRNVGAVAVMPGQIAVIGRSTNTGFNQSITNLFTSNQANYYFTAPAEAGRLSINLNPATAVNKGGMTTITVNFAKNTGEHKGYRLLSGDVITIKVTTTAGTFAQGTYTVP
jgi:FlaG/FlaF family flagellin (archaellin)